MGLQSLVTPTNFLFVVYQSVFNSCYISYLVQKVVERRVIFGKNRGQNGTKYKYKFMYPRYCTNSSVTVSSLTSVVTS